MAEKKEHLEGLLEIIKVIISKEENQWFKENLLKNVIENTQLSSGDTFENNPVINRIYEHCIEVIIKKQASQFYGNFVLDNIKPQLIIDFESMEHHRRRDDFEAFCLAAFQQLENITISLFDKLKNEILSKRTLPAFNQYVAGKGEWIKTPGGYRIDLLLFGEKKDTDPSKLNNEFSIGNMDKWYFTNKYRAVLYFSYFNNNLKNLEEFNLVYELGMDLYQMRNKNHRGGKTSPFQMEKIKKIESDIGKYYFIFYGFLADFTSRINFYLLNQIKNSNQKQKKIINSPLEGNHVLNALKQKLEDSKEK